MHHHNTEKTGFFFVTQNEKITVRLSLLLVNRLETKQIRKMRNGKTQEQQQQQQQQQGQQQQTKQTEQNTKAIFFLQMLQYSGQNS